MNKSVLLWSGIALAGAVGSVARFGVSQLWGLFTAYPLGTLTVNLLGAFALGWVNAVFSASGCGTGGDDMRTLWKLILGVGLLGGFTTFSSMMFDADKMMIDAQFLRTAAYLAASIFLGLVAVRAGVIVGKGL